MYLLYVDESGNPDSATDRHFVLGGVAMFERKVFWVNEEVDKLQESLFPGVQVEFHAQEIVAHAQEPWHSLPSDKRTETLQSLCRVISSSNDIYLFAVAIERSTTKEPLIRAFEELCNRFDLFLKRLHAQGNTQRGLVIFDETRYEKTLQTLLATYRGTGTRFGRVYNFADIPFFTDSKSTRLLQLADLVSYAVFRRYERANTWLLDQIIGNFDTEGGVIHGLVHLTANRSACTCPSCLTRRLVPREERL